MSQSIHSYVSSEGKLSLEIIRTAESLLAQPIEPKQTEDPKIELLKCICKKRDEGSDVRISPTHVEEILREKEKELREEYDRILQREKQLIKERYNLILLNEQTRACYMLREAHRERQEKIHALQSQLQCKNLAALMYVMCTERKRSRFEKLQIIEDYTNYINVLHDILTKGQELILHLSKGYKTAARVDHEWREKMKKVVSQFLCFIYHFAGGDPETNQYLIDLPKWLKTDAPLDIDPNEDPCDCDDEEDELPKEMPRFGDKEWWEDLDAEHAPFVMFGDMGEFQPDQKRKTLKSVKAQKIKAQKTAPKEWKELALKDMFLKSKCVHLDKIKSLYKDKLPTPIKWDCLHSPPELRGNSKLSIPASHRGASFDIRGTMGSILKIIAMGPTSVPVAAKTELLGARDSIEIASTTRVRMSIKSDVPEHHYPQETVVLNIKKRASMFADDDDEDDEDDLTVETHQLPRQSKHSASRETHEDNIDDLSLLGSLHTDSLQMIHNRHPESQQDPTINYERVCPMEKCQRMQVDSFMRSLPPYMRANPFTHFEQTFEEYETCSPEQLQILQERIENKNNIKSKKDVEVDSESLESPLSEWFNTGVGVQTSEVNVEPPCPCHDELPRTSGPREFVFDLADLELVKRAMDAIHKECFFSDEIEFRRFKLLGKDLDCMEQIQEEKRRKKQTEAEFRESRYQEISEILNKHPSLLDIFQANTK